jgi:apolipoprotein N-acyltransferase
MNGLAEKNAAVVFVLTNDAWFYSTAEAEQHFNMTKMRAAETGKPVVQAANTGISGFIDSRGETDGTIRLNRVGTIQNTVTGNRGRTIYTIFGRFLPIIIVLVTVIIITVLRLVHICTRRRRAGIIKAKNLHYSKANNSA